MCYVNNDLNQNAMGHKLCGALNGSESILLWGCVFGTFLSDEE